MRPVILALLVLPCAAAIARPYAGRYQGRPRLVTPISTPPAADRSNALNDGSTGSHEMMSNDATLVAVRRSVTRIRKLRRQAKVHAMRLSRSSRAAAEAVYGEYEAYTESLATLEDIQRSMLRATKMGVLRERRAAQRKWIAWRRAEERDGQRA